jgi:hypothetical protein
VTEHTETMVVGEYFLAIEGFAMIRHCLTSPSAARPRVDEMREILTGTNELYSLRIPLTEHEVETGYTEWAPRYDGPNPAIAAEQPIVHGMLDAIAPGVSLDPRRRRPSRGKTRRARPPGHRRRHHECNADVAREVPAARPRRPARSLPIDDASVDVLTCTLTHARRAAESGHKRVRVYCVPAARQCCRTCPMHR